MKKTITLAALVLMSAAFDASAQVTLDGQVLPAEGYVQLGAFTGPRGFGDHGLVRLYVRNTATKYYIAVTGALESNGNSFQIFLNQPRKTGVAANTTLPPSSLTGTSFEINDPKLEFEVDYGFGVKGGATVSASSIIDYTRVVGSLATDQLVGDLPVAGTATTAPAATTGGLQLIRMAFKNVFFLVGPNPATPLHTGVEAWEIELDKATMDIQTGDNLQFFAVMSSQKGDFYSTDAIPEVTGNTSNLGASPNFVTLPGTQFVNTSVITSVRNAQDATKLNVQVAPNPMNGAAKVLYSVTDRAADVQISLTNLLGQEVRRFSPGRQPVGRHEVNLAGPGLAAGTYVLKVQAGNSAATQKVVVQ